MPIWGKPVVKATLDVDQSVFAGDYRGKDWTYLQEFAGYDIDDLGLPADNLVLAVSWSYGRDRFIVGDFQTGLATVVLNNDSGEFSPYSGVNAIGGDKLAPGQFMQIDWRQYDLDTDDYMNTHSVYDDWTSGGRYPDDAETVTDLVGGEWTIHTDESPDGVFIDWASVDAAEQFLGRILHIEDVYDVGGHGCVTVVTLVDAMAEMAGYEPGPVSPDRAAESYLDRSTYLFGQVFGVTGFSSQTGLYDIEASDLDGNFLDLARQTAAAEGGAIFADHRRRGGYMINMPANWLISTDWGSTVPQFHFGDPANRYGINSATTRYSLTRVFNALEYSNSSTTVSVSDSTSQDTYGIRYLSRTLINNDNTDLDTIADRDLALLKDAKLVVESITIDVDNMFQSYAVSQLALGEMVKVTIANDGWDYEQDLHVAGISHTWDAASNTWVATFRLDSREGDTEIS